MEEQHKQDLKPPDEVDGVRAKLTATFEKETFVESESAAYEMNAGKRQTVGSVGRSTESLTEETSQTVHQREQEPTHLHGGVMNGSIETLTTRLQDCKQELVRFEVRQCKWRERERFLEVKLMNHQKQKNTERGDGVEIKSSEGVVKESSAESERWTEQSGRVPDRSVRQELEERVAVSESKLKEAEDSLAAREKELQKVREELSLEKEKSRQKECDELKEESLKETPAMGGKVRVQEKESQEKTLLKNESTPNSPFKALLRKWEKVSTSGTAATTETESELCADDSPANTRLTPNKSNHFEKERARFSAREEELEMKIQLLESQVTELQEEAQKDRPQRETVDKPCTKEMEVQTIDDVEQEVEDVQEEQLTFNKERAEWREERQELEERVAVSESKLKEAEESLAEKEEAMEKLCEEWVLEQEEFMQKKCEDLKEYQETLRQCLAMGEKVTVLEKDRESLEKTVARLKEELTQKDEAAQRKWEKLSTPETAATTETQSELCADDSQANKQLTPDKSKEHDFEKELEMKEEHLAERAEALEKEREEWLLEKENSAQKECEELKEHQETLEQCLVMGQKLIILEKDCETLDKTVALLKRVLTQKDEAFSAREKELELKIHLLESQVTELQEEAQKDCPQRETVDKPCTKETEVQAIKDMEQEVEDVQEEFKHLVQSLQSEQLTFNKERAEWREERQELEERVAVSESKLKAAEESLAERDEALEKEREERSLEKEKSEQKECEDLKQHQETLKQCLAMAQKFTVLEKDRESLEKTVALLKEESTQKDEASSAREKELKTKLQLLESQVTELREEAREDCPQRETVDKPCTKEMEVQTIDDMEHKVEEKFKYLVHRLQSEKLTFNKERAEWREERQRLEERVTVSEEHLVQYHALEQKLIVLEKERDSLEKTVALLKEESTQKDEAARRQQDKASTSETAAATGDFDLITKQQLDETEMSRVRALVHRLHSHCGQRADALEEEGQRLRNIVQTLSVKLQERERNEVRLEEERKEFERRAVEAEAQLGKALGYAARMEKALEEERDMVQEMETLLYDQQKDNVDLKTTVENLKEQQRELEENEETSGANEALVLELRGKLQNELTIRWFQWEREKCLMAQQERLEEEKKQLERRVEMFSDGATRLSAKLTAEREKTWRLEEQVEEMKQKLSTRYRR